MAFWIDHAARIICAGGIVVYPTESLMAIGCSVDSEWALSRLCAIKKRDPGKGFVVVADSVGRLAPYLSSPLTKEELSCIEGADTPTSWVAKASEGVSDRLVALPQRTLAFRISPHPVVRALCQAAQTPLVATSANPHQRKPACYPWVARRYFKDAVDCYIGRLALQKTHLPSRIVDLSTNRVYRASCKT